MALCRQYAQWPKSLDCGVDLILSYLTPWQKQLLLHPFLIPHPITSLHWVARRITSPCVFRSPTFSMSLAYMIMFRVPRRSRNVVTPPNGTLLIAERSLPSASASLILWWPGKWTVSNGEWEVNKTAMRPVPVVFKVWKNSHVLTRTVSFLYTSFVPNGECGEHTKIENCACWPQVTHVFTMMGLSTLFHSAKSRKSCRLQWCQCIYCSKNTFSCECMIGTEWCTKRTGVAKRAWQWSS